MLYHTNEILILPLIGCACTMKIAVVSSYNPFHSINRFIGGAEVYSLNLSIKLAKFKNEVTLFIGSESTGDYIINDNLRIKYVRTVRLPFGSRIPLNFVQNLISNSYDIIHVHQLFTTFNLLSCFTGKLRNTPTVLTDHGGGWKVLAALPHICAKFPDAFAAVSNFSLQWLIRFAIGKKSTIVYGGVNVDFFHPKYNVDKLRQDFDLDGFHVVLCVGRLLSHKGIDVLIRAFRFLPSNTKLLVVGPIQDYGYYDYLRILVDKNCPERVIFTGEVHPKKLPEFYNVCDMFVQPSVYRDYRGDYHRFPELLGLTKLEAMACRKPVIVSDVGGLPELIANGKNGYVVKAGDEKELAERINDILINEKNGRKMGREGLALVRKHYTWDSIAERVLDSYNSLINF